MVEYWVVTVWSRLVVVDCWSIGEYVVMSCRLPSELGIDNIGYD